MRLRHSSVKSQCWWNVKQFLDLSFPKWNAFLEFEVSSSLEWILKSLILATMFHKMGNSTKGFKVFSHGFMSSLVQLAPSLHLSSSCMHVYIDLKYEGFTMQLHKKDKCITKIIWSLIDTAWLIHTWYSWYSPSIIFVIFENTKWPKKYYRIIRF